MLCDLYDVNDVNEYIAAIALTLATGKKDLLSLFDLIFSDKPFKFLQLLHREFPFSFVHVSVSSLY